MVKIEASGILLTNLACRTRDNSSDSTRLGFDDLADPTLPRNRPYEKIENER